MEDIDVDDVMEGSEAVDGFMALVRGGLGLNLGLYSASGEDGGLLVFVEADAETFAMTPDQALGVAVNLSRAAHANPTSPAFDALLGLSDAFQAVLVDMLSSDDELTLH